MMNRPSTLSARPSTINGGSGTSRAAQGSNAVAARILEKRQEWEAVNALEQTTTEIKTLLENLANQANIMADGGQTVAAVMANWPNVLRIIGLFAKDANGSASADHEAPGHSEQNEALPRLVRIDVSTLSHGNN